MQMFITRAIVFTSIFYLMYVVGLFIFEFNQELIPLYITVIFGLGTAYIMKLYED